MRMSKKALFAALLAATFTVSAGAAFEKTNTYTAGQFTDVPASEWYAAEVQSTYELGLMNGVGSGLFDPNGNVTVAEAITMAARAASINAADTIPAAEGEWYQMYVNYALAKGFVTQGQFDSYDRPAKRYEVAKLFENAMPEGYFEAKNDVTAIPDVAQAQPYYADLISLYRAGVVMGSDSYGNFRPEDNIVRAEAAAIINRVALPENRLVKTLDTVSQDDAYLLTSITGYAGSNQIGMKTGWLLDNRGGIPMTSINVNLGIVTDISEDAGVAVIREFNKTETGNVVLEADYSLKDDIDGSYIEYVNEKGESVYRIEVQDGEWRILGADGAYTKIADAAVGTYVLYIAVDLDNARSTTCIDGVNLGTYPLAKAKSDIINLRFGCTDEGTSMAGPGDVDMYVNYAVYNKFSFDAADKTPFAWTGTGLVKNGLLEIAANGSASKAFNPVSGTVAAETEMLIDSATNATYRLRSGDKDVVVLSFDGTNVGVNGQNVYEYYDGLWYRFRFELDTVNMQVCVKINGRQIAVVPFAEKATSVDNLTVSNAGTNVLKSDNYKVFTLQQHEDYVPAPVKPAGEEKYTVGMNVCSLWVEGTHSGWATISPYERPVLGFYDEGSKESADWEIKYMVEHGIDFQAFCWYADNSNDYIKTPRLVSQLHDGYMNAEYSDQMKYCLIWEAGNGARPKNMEAFKKYYVPYFVENYFKDPRYMTIDNKPVLCFFSAGSLAKSTSLGSNAAVKEALDMLRDEVKKLGYDDLIIIGNTAQAQAAEFGLDGIYAYNWGTAGYLLSTNYSRNLSTAKGSPYTVPTISVGFNSIPWHGARHPMMTPADFLTAQEWVKNDYLPTYAKEDWQKNFVMLSTWNEYGEGTFIMPGEQNGGFGYLDALREAYTDEAPDESKNLVPSEEQLRRINRMYPQYRRHLRDTGYSELAAATDGYDTVYTIDMTAQNLSDICPTGLVDVTVDQNGVNATSEIADAYFFPKMDEVDLESVVALRIVAKLPAGITSELFFISKESTDWAQKKSVNFASTSDDWKEYVVKVDKTVWGGTLTQLRVDLTNRPDQTFSVKSIEFLKNKDVETNEFVINGMTVSGKTPNVVKEDGTVLSAFDPSLAMDYRLNAFYTWDMDNGVLELQFQNTDVVFTVGSDTFTVNGTEKPLGYTLYLEDGLPMLDFKKLCEAVGYTYAFKDGVTTIDTDQKAYFAELAKQPLGSFEFNTLGNTEGWGSSAFSLTVGRDGVMKYQQTSSSTDPTTTNKLSTPLPTAQFNVLRIRMKHEIDRASSRICMYFITDKDGTWNEAKALSATIGKDSGGEFVEYTIDLSKYTTWSGNVTSLRYDPYDGIGYAEVDYIRFEYDENYGEPFDKAKNDPNTQYNAKFDKFEIINGDAEGTGGFISRNGTISIVEDPDNPNNKCYLVVPKDTSKVWVYADQSVRYNKGATYKVELDIRIAAHGTDLSPAKDFKAKIMANAVYADPGKSVDHVVARFGDLSVGEGWKHVTYEFTVSVDSIDRSKDAFCLYADPIDDLGVGYYFDNVTVTEILPEKNANE